MTQTYKNNSDNSKLIQADIDTVDPRTKTLYVTQLDTNKEIIMAVSMLKKYWTVVNNTP